MERLKSNIRSSCSFCGSTGANHPFAKGNRPTASTNRVRRIHYSEPLRTRERRPTRTVPYTLSAGMLGMGSDGEPPVSMLRHQPERFPTCRWRSCRLLPVVAIIGTIEGRVLRAPGAHAGGDRRINLQLGWRVDVAWLLYAGAIACAAAISSRTYECDDLEAR